MGRGINAAPREGTITIVTPLERPNEIVCNVFSCMDDPRAPASTDLLLSYKMLEQGAGMGARGDKRVTAAGLLSNVVDVGMKFDDYLEFAASRAPKR
mmetsp:Transcript_1321/g.5403  ORF Transcript_1321/g.5403 Transcript_1321/m.5403 type:complete len:97 (-) Transcript_1321:109-399(-)